jgi:hypothetical protein
MASRETINMDLLLTLSSDMGPIDKIVLIAWNVCRGNIAPEVIAKKTNLSTEEAEYRITKLVEEGRIAGKKCTGPCGRVLPPTSLHFHRKGGGVNERLKSQCKECFNQSHRIYPSPGEEVNHRSESAKYRWKNMTKEERSAIFRKEKAE